MATAAPIFMTEGWGLQGPRLKMFVATHCPSVGLSRGNRISLVVNPGQEAGGGGWSLSPLGERGWGNLVEHYESSRSFPPSPVPVGHGIKNI